ncbi:hypothetical protein Tco_1519796 [Tanacetum coccineum]
MVLQSLSLMRQPMRSMYLYITMIHYLAEKVNKLERKSKSRTPRLKRLRKVGRTTRIEYSEDEGFGAQEDASKQGRKIANLDEVEVEKVVSTAEVTTARATTTTVNELTLAQTLIEIKEAKPKAVTTTTTAVTRPKARGVKLAKQREEDANIAEYDKVQAMIDADYELAARLKVQEQEKLTIKERSKMFVELIDKTKKHFARLKAEEQKRKPPTKAQKRSKIYGYRVGKRELQEGRDAKEDDEAEMKKHMEIVLDDEVAIDAIPLATKPPIIVNWKIIKEGKMGYFQIIRADGSSRRYSSMIRML